MKTVISCSRRTDIPAFYYEWLQEKLKEGSVTLLNDYNQQNYTVDLSPENTHSIVLWSKDYSKFLADPGLLANYNLFFQFTITGYGKGLEANVPEANETIEQIHRLSERYSPDQINWRFDPLIFQKSEAQMGSDRLIVFDKLCNGIGSAGVKRCTISFATFYGQVSHRLLKHGIKFIEPSADFQREFVAKMVEIADKYGITIYTCANPIIEAVKGVEKSHCIDGDVLSRLFGEKATKARDAGQREACGCTKSRDIGAYKQVCKSGCYYCYQQSW